MRKRESSSDVPPLASGSEPPGEQVRQDFMGTLAEEERRIVLRILDVNANRCAEGLRAIEELARFDARHEGMFKRVKDVRHAVREGLRGIAGQSLDHRDSDSDIGRSWTTRTEMYRGSLTDLASANFHRAEEALRVLEEYSKLIDGDAAGLFKALRFELYTMEREFIGPGGGRAAIPPPPFLYAILDRSCVTREGVARAAGELAGGGVGMIQYRAKACGPDEQRTDLVTVIARAAEQNVPVIVNDHPELAVETGAQGVHLGMSDAEPAVARGILGRGSVIGLTIHTMEELEKAPLAEVDYIAVGPVFRSPTKPGRGPVGPRFIAAVREAVDIPVVAIGGIDPSNIDLVLDQGAHGIACVSALLTGDIGKNCFTLNGIIGRRRKDNNIKD